MKRGLTLGASIAVVALLLWWLFRSAPEQTSRDAPAPRGTHELSEQRRDAPGVLPAATATAAPQERARIIFGVIRDPDGAPVIGATVRASRRARGEALVARTGESGEYVLLGASGAIVRLEFSATGFEPSVFDEPALPGDQRVRWDVVLHPALGIHGVVRCPDGPAGGARLYLRRGRKVTASARSDGDGRFALELAEDASPEGLELMALHGECGRGSVPITSRGAVRIDLPGGGWVEGTVTDREGRPITELTVSASSLSDDAGGPPALSVDDPRGMFRLGPLAPGEQRIYVASPGYRPGRSDRITITSGETALVSFVLERSAELRGRVTDTRTGAPIEGAQIVPAEWRSDALADSVGAITDADGRYVLRTLPGGRTTIMATARGYRPLMHGGVEGGSKTPLELDFALTPAAAGDRGSSELIGIGAQLSKTQQGVVVRGILEGGAASGQLQEGDLIVMVGELAADRAELGEIVQRIRGEAGSEVVLWVRRAGSSVPERVVLERRRVPVPEQRHP